MLTRKCDICGAEMRITTPRYKVTFEGWLYTQEKDICIDCFKRIADEIRQADTPQTDWTRRECYDGCEWPVGSPQCEGCDRLPPQTDCGWK